MVSAELGARVGLMGVLAIAGVACRATPDEGAAEQPWTHWTRHGAAFSFSAPVVGEDCMCRLRFEARSEADGAPSTRLLELSVTAFADLDGDLEHDPDEPRDRWSIRSEPDGSDRMVVDPLEFRWIAGAHVGLSLEYLLVDGRREQGSLSLLPTHEGESCPR